MLASFIWTVMHPYGWPKYKWYYLYSCRNFPFFFPVWHSEGKTRRILLGFEQKRLYPLMIINRIIVTFGENANMRWEKIIIICFLACHWCIKHNKLFQYYHFYTWCYWVSLNDLSSIINIVIMFHIYQQGKTGVSFWSVFLGAGISFQILAPTLEKALFWISSLDFLI